MRSKYARQKLKNFIFYPSKLGQNLNGVEFGLRDIEVSVNFFSQVVFPPGHFDRGLTREVIVGT